MIDKKIQEYNGDELVKEYKGECFYVVEGENDNHDDDKNCFHHPDHKTKYLEWMKHYWRPSMAALYFFIVLLDFGIRPIVNVTLAKEFSLGPTVEAVKDLEPIVQIEAIKIASRQEVWPMITTPDIHYTFLVILGIAAWTRGKEKEALAGNGGL